MIFAVFLIYSLRQSSQRIGSFKGTLEQIATAAFAFKASSSSLAPDDHATRVNHCQNLTLPLRCHSYRFSLQNGKC